MAMSEATKGPEESEEQESASTEPLRPQAAPLPLERDERRARLLILTGAALMMFGIVLALGDDELSRWLTVAGIVISFVALHRFGRLGPAASVLR
jgi:hypothetical protein